jgi:hypothetical protein
LIGDNPEKKTAHHGSWGASEDFVPWSELAPTQDMRWAATLNHALVMPSGQAGAYRPHGDCGAGDSCSKAPPPLPNDA